MSAPGVLLVLLAMLLASDAAEAEGAGIIDFFKDAVLGDSKQQALFMGVKTEVRQHAAQELQAMITESRRDASAAATPPTPPSTATSTTTPRSTTTGSVPASSFMRSPPEQIGIVQSERICTSSLADFSAS